MKTVIKFCSISALLKPNGHVSVDLKNQSFDRKKAFYKVTSDICR